MGLSLIPFDLLLSPEWSMENDLYCASIKPNYIYISNTGAKQHVLFPRISEVHIMPCYNVIFYVTEHVNEKHLPVKIS